MNRFRATVLMAVAVLVIPMMAHAAVAKPLICAEVIGEQSCKGLSQDMCCNLAAKAADNLGMSKVQSLCADPLTGGFCVPLVKAYDPKGNRCAVGLKCCGSCMFPISQTGAVFPLTQ